LLSAYQEDSGPAGLLCDREGLVDEAGGAADVGGLAAARADRADHRPGDRGGEGGQDRVQGALSLDPSDFGALLGVAVHAAVGGVDVDEHDLLGPGQQRGVPGKAGQELPVHTVQLAVVAVGEGAQEGAQGGGARTPPKARSIAPCRNWPASLILSAPAHIAPSSDITFAAGWAPPLLSASSIRIEAARSGSPARSARRTSGSSPASATRFGSSKMTETAVTAWEDCISRMFSRSVDLEP
jgi:hypothetical protein